MLRGICLHFCVFCFVLWRFPFSSLFLVCMWQPPSSELTLSKRCTFTFSFSDQNIWATIRRCFIPDDIGHDELANVNEKKKSPFMLATTFKRKLSVAKQIKEKKKKSWNWIIGRSPLGLGVCVCVYFVTLNIHLDHDWAIWAIPLILKLFNFWNASFIFISMAIQLKIFHTKQI